MNKLNNEVLVEDAAMPMNAKMLQKKAAKGLKKVSAAKAPVTKAVPVMPKAAMKNPKK